MRLQRLAGGLQMQERRTCQVADWLEAEHSCMTLRGVEKPGSRTVTSALRGVLRSDARSRQGFFAIARSN